MPTIKLRRKTNAAGSPSSLVDGEIAVNQSEGCIYGIRGSQIARYSTPLGFITYLDRDPVNSSGGVVLIFDNPVKIEITGLIGKTSAGSIKVKLVKTATGGTDSDIHSSTAVTINTTKGTTSITSSNTVDAGEALKLVLSDASTPKDLELQISYKFADLGANSSEG